MHQRLCLNCQLDAIPGRAYCMDCEAVAKRMQQAERDRLDEEIERRELEYLYNIPGERSKT